MRGMNRSLGVSFVVAVVLLGFASEAFAQRYDQIVRQHDNREETINGIIENITRTRIELQQVDGDRVRPADYPIEEITDWTINYRLRLRGGDGPFRGQAFADGRQAMLNSNWSQAIFQFSATVQDTPDDFARMIARMHLVECGLNLGSGTANVRGQGNRQEQLSGYAVAGRFADQFQRSHGNSYYIGDVLVWAGRAHEESGNTSDAIGTYRALAEFDPAEGNYRMAQLHYRAEQWTEARDAYSRARDAARRDGYTTMVEACDVAIGRVNIEMGSWDSARQVFEQLVGEDGSHDRSVLGTAYLGLGLCLANQQRWRAAFDALATAATAFKENIGDADLQLALGLCVRIAERLAENDEEWQERAERLRNEFSQRYRGVPLPDLR